MSDLNIFVEKQRQMLICIRNRNVFAISYLHNENYNSIKWFSKTRKSFLFRKHISTVLIIIEKSIIANDVKRVESLLWCWYCLNYMNTSCLHLLLKHLKASEVLQLLKVIWAKKLLFFFFFSFFRVFLLVNYFF